jgi:hypothetical protein
LKNIVLSWIEEDDHKFEVTKKCDKNVWNWYHSLFDYFRKMF